MRSTESSGVECRQICASYSVVSLRTDARREPSRSIDDQLHYRLNVRFELRHLKSRGSEPPDTALLGHGRVYNTGMVNVDGLSPSAPLASAVGTPRTILNNRAEVCMSGGPKGTVAHLAEVTVAEATPPMRHMLRRPGVHLNNKRTLPPQGLQPRAVLKAAALQKASDASASVPLQYVVASALRSGDRQRAQRCS